MNYSLPSGKMKPGTIAFLEDILALWSEFLQNVGIERRMKNKVENVFNRLINHGASTSEAFPVLFSKSQKIYCIERLLDLRIGRMCYIEKWRKNHEGNIDKFEWHKTKHTKTQKYLYVKTPSIMRN